MTIPGFTAGSAVYQGRTTGFGRLPTGTAVRAGDRVVPQGLCEIELGPVCRMKCRNSWDPRRCFNECIKEMCKPDYGDYW